MEKPRIRRAAGSRRTGSREIGVKEAAALINGGQGAFPQIRAGYGVAMHEVIASQLPRLISQSRRAAMNVDLSVSYSKMVRRNVVGPKGIRLSSQVKDASGSRNEDASKAVEAAWSVFSRRGNCTVQRDISFRTLLAMAITAWRTDGNFLGVHRFGRRQGRFFYRFQPLPFEALALDHSVDRGASGRIENGIEFDEWGAVSAYYFRIGSGTRPALRRIRADLVVHAFDRHSVGMHLGFPAGHAALSRIGFMNELEKSQLRAAKWGAEKMGFMTKSAEISEDAPRPKDDPTEDGDESASESTIFDVEGGAVIELPEGYDIKSLDFDYPAIDPAPFARFFQMGAAASWGVSHGGLTGNVENLNYSSLRDARGEERSGWQITQQDLIEQVVEPIFQNFIRGAVMANELTPPNGDVDALFDGVWRPRGWQPVNQKEEAAANDADLEKGLTSPGILIERRGEDPDEVFERIKADREKYAKIGVNFSEEGAPTPSETGEPPETE